MEDKIQNPENKNPYLFLRPLFIVALLLFALLISLQIPLPDSMGPMPKPSKDVYGDRLQKMGAPTDKFNNLLEKIKRDINKENVTIKVLIGPYFMFFNIKAALIPPLIPNIYDPNPNRLQTYLIVIDGDLFDELNLEEQKALVAHETGHLLYVSNSFNLESLVDAQILADSFAAKYVAPKDILSLLDKVFSEYVKRHENLKKLSQTR